MCTGYFSFIWMTIIKENFHFVSICKVIENIWIKIKDKYNLDKYIKFYYNWYNKNIYQSLKYLFMLSKFL